jgi:multimeric flavodoxin WrbA
MGKEKVLAINSSPNMANGNTARILNPFIDGMKEAGADVELFYLKKMKIRPCLGCLKCWTKTPGECIISDDMDGMLPKIKEADIMVFATPLYWDGVSGLMKMFMDRMTPLGEPFIEIIDGRSRHPVREGFAHGKLVLVSTCGFFEEINFEPMLIHMKAAAFNLRREFAGALLRPNAMSIKPAEHFNIPLDDIYEAAKVAGVELIENGKMSEETIAAVGREFISLEQFAENANTYFGKLYKKLGQKHTMGK